VETQRGTREFVVHLVDWPGAADALREVRRAVFIVEQSIPEELEWDEFDAPSRHALAVDASGRAIGCGRLLADGHVGRLAVLSAWRGRGVGAAILDTLVELARVRGHKLVILNSQVHAMPFYARHGFAAVGDVYVEAGIPHQTMERSLLA
jgi:predicted GNAT family N-acyltransferase